MTDPVLDVLLNDEEHQRDEREHPPRHRALATPGRDMSDETAADENHTNTGGQEEGADVRRREQLGAAVTCRRGPIEERLRALAARDKDGKNGEPQRPLSEGTVQPAAALIGRRLGLVASDARTRRGPGSPEQRSPDRLRRPPPVRLEREMNTGLALAPELEG